MEQIEWICRTNKNSKNENVWKCEPRTQLKEHFESTISVGTNVKLSGLSPLGILFPGYSGTVSQVIGQNILVVSDETPSLMYWYNMSDFIGTPTSIVVSSPSPSVVTSPSPSVVTSPSPSVVSSPSPSVVSSPSPSVVSSPSPLSPPSSNEPLPNKPTSQPLSASSPVIAQFVEDSKLLYRVTDNGYNTQGNFETHFPSSTQIILDSRKPIFNSSGNITNFGSTADSPLIGSLISGPFVKPNTTVVSVQNSGRIPSNPYVDGQKITINQPLENIVENRGQVFIYTFNRKVS